MAAAGSPGGSSGTPTNNSTSELLTQLVQDRDDLVTNLTTKGITGLTGDETFTELVPEVLNISGGADISEYFNTTINENTAQNNSVIVKSLKKLPNITIGSNVTNLSYAFHMFKGSTLPTITIQSNNITDTSYMFNSCSNATSFPQIDTSKCTTVENMFNGCASAITLPSLDLSMATTTNGLYMNCQSLQTAPSLNTSNVESFSNMFYGCKSLRTIPQYDTSNGQKFSSMFYHTASNEYSLWEEIPLLDFSSAISVRSMLNSNWGNSFQHTSGFNNLTILGGFKDLGEAYLTTRAANYADYKLDLSYLYNLTHDSLMNVINNLYDIATKGCNTQQLVLGSYNLAKLSAAEIAIATNKGWAVS